MSAQLGVPRLAQRTTANTGLLRAICDPYGAESRIRLLGGVFPESHVGKTMWHCRNYADGRYRAECQRGHRAGNIMPLCYDHVRSIQARQMGLCPRCAWPPEAINLNRWIEENQRAFQAALMARDRAAADRHLSRVAAMTDRMTELWQSGVIRKTPLTLAEVS